MRISLGAQIFLAFILGGLTGWIWGKDAAPLGEIAKTIIQLVKAMATPLLFFAIIDAILRAEVSGKNALRMVAIALFNAGIALCIALALTNYFEPGKTFRGEAAAGADLSAYQNKMDFMRFLTGHLPTSVIQPFAENAALSAVLLALLVGFAVKAVKKEIEAENGRPFEGAEVASGFMLRALAKAIHYVTALLPLAVFGAIARTVGEYGLSKLGGLASYLGVGLFGLSLQILFTYQTWILFWAKIPLKVFWEAARAPVLFAFGANSSLATLPVTLDALENKLKISPAAARLGACVGTNLNNDGILLYEAMAALFIAQASGIALSFGEQIFIAFGCMAAAMGVAGVPEAGIISLSLVLSTVGLPVELLPVLLSVDWILARARSVTNVLSDITVSIALDGWMKKDIKL